MQTVNKSLSPQLFPYQLHGAKWLASHTHALLADEMGLGKSAQAIHACDLIHAKVIVVICPASVKANWAREWSMFHSEELNPNATPHFFSYNKATDANKLKQFDVLVIDESHFLKSPKAARTKAIYGKSGIIRRARRTYCLSGTPAPNNASEVWTLLFTFGVTKLKHGQFIERFCDYYDSGYGRTITGTNTKRIPELKALLSKVMLRRQKDEVMKELPEIFFQNTVVPRNNNIELETEVNFIQYFYPKDRQDELWDKLKKEEMALELLVKLNEAGSTMSPTPMRDTLNSLEAMSNSISTLRRYIGIQKIKSVADIVEQELEAKAYQKIVIFAIHQAVIEGLRDRLKRFGVVTLYGKTPYEKKQKNVDRFQKNPKCRVFIGNIQAAGTGITLTAAHNVLFAEQSWVPGDNAQAAMRCHRIGQTKPVTVRFVGMADSIDERVAKILKRKTQELTQIFDKERLPIVEKSVTDFDNAPIEEFKDEIENERIENDFEGDIFS